MLLSHEHVGSKIPAKINIYMLTRAELHIHLCYDIPCSFCDSRNKIGHNFWKWNNFLLKPSYFQEPIPFLSKKKMEFEDAKPTIDLAIFKVDIAIVGTVFFYFHFFISKISQGRNRFMVYLQLLRFRHLVFSKKKWANFETCKWKLCNPNDTSVPDPNSSKPNLHILNGQDLTRRSFTLICPHLWRRV